jgi:hypothetical protein
MVYWGIIHGWCISVLDTVRFDNKVYVEQYNDRCHYGIKECVYINIDTTDRMGKKAKQLLPKQQEPDTEHVEAIDPSTIPKPRLDHSKYWCGHCNFSARTPSSYRNHLYSTRHFRNYQADSVAKAQQPDLDTVMKNTEDRIEPQPSMPCIGVPSNEIIHLLGSDTESDGERVSDTELNTETASDNESNTELNTETASDNEPNTESEYEYETGPETETETESNTETEEYDNDFDRDLPWFGTGLFAHHHRSHRSIGGWNYLTSSDGATGQPLESPSRPDFVGQSNHTSSGVARKSSSTQPQEFGTMSICIASAFIGGMLLEWFMTQYVHGMCAC